jgi:predicted ArsR family transcriptional regulator
MAHPEERIAVTEHPIHRLDDDVHQRVRLGILANLAGVARVDFAYLRNELGVTDGNLGRHLEVLEDAGYVAMTRSSGAGRPRTWIKITKAGRDALRREVEALRQILAATPDTDDAHDIPPNPAPTTALEHDAPG